MVIVIIMMMMMMIIMIMMVIWWSWWYDDHDDDDDDDDMVMMYVIHSTNICHRFGRRKSWLVPVQYLIGKLNITLMVGSISYNYLIGMQLNIDFASQPTPPPPSILLFLSFVTKLMPFIGLAQLLIAKDRN